MSKGNWFLGLVCVLLSFNAGASEFNYAELQTKALDEMQAVINKQIKKSAQFAKEDNEEQAVNALKSALQLIFSRPNRDNMVSQLIPPVRSKLRELDAFDKAVGEIAQESISKINNKKLKAGQRATQYFVLENILSEFKPEVSTNDELRAIFVKIQSAKIELDGSVKNDLKMRAMYKTPLSPSDIAAKVLAAVKKPAPETPAEGDDED